MAQNQGNQINFFYLKNIIFLFFLFHFLNILRHMPFVIWNDFFFQNCFLLSGIYLGGKKFNFENTASNVLSLYLNDFEHSALSIIVTTAKLHSHLLHLECACVSISVVTLIFHCQCQEINSIFLPALFSSGQNQT